MVETVLGPVAASALGATLMHEHVFTLFADLRLQRTWDEEASVALAVARLRELRATGFETIVDMTVWGLGRYVPRIARIAGESGVTIVVATGVYTFSDLQSWFRNHTVFVDGDFVSSVMIDEIRNGIEGTGIKPAVLKCVTDHQGVTADVDLLIRQTAKAQLATGVPIITHSHAGTRRGLEQQRILAECGVDLGEVLIGHAGDATDLSYLEELIAHGSWLGMDRFGFGPSGSLESKMDVVAAMCQRGYANRMVLSHDTNVASDNVPETIRSTPDFANWRYTCIPELVLPGLRERGVSDQELRTMIVDNPAAILSIGGGR